MVRIRRMVAVIAVSVVALSGCQTTGDGSSSGAAIGGATGAAAGAGSVVGTAIAGGGMSSQNLMVGLLVGAVVGAVAGNALIGAPYRPLDDSDTQKANDAARRAAANPDLGQVRWESEKNPGVYGWSEALPSTGREENIDCRLVRMIYYPDGEQRAGNKLFCRSGGAWIAS